VPIKLDKCRGLPAAEVRREPERIVLGHAF